MGALPAEHTILQGAALAALVEERWDIGPVDGGALWATAVNDTHVVRAAGRELALRVYRHGWRTDAEVDVELTTLLGLRDRGADVAAPIVDRDGRAWSILTAPEGPRQIALFDWAAGRRLVPELDHARAYGRAVAELHDAADGVAPTGHRRLDLDHLLDEPVGRLAPVLSARPDEQRYLTELAATTRTELEARTDALDWGFCHGDLHGGNATTNDGVITHFDFDCSGFGWRAYDLAVYRWATEATRPSDGSDECWVEFLAGYRERRALDDADVEAVPSFVVARHLWLMGLHAQVLSGIGAQYLGDIWIERHFEILRSWGKRHSEAG